MISDKPKIILASYPRSGNTFLRNILYEVYGIFSWESIELFRKNLNIFNDLANKLQNKGLNDAEKNQYDELHQKLKWGIIKTHELPSKIIDECDENVKIVYLVRDGRDALVSQAHHNINIINPGSDFKSSLTHSILAPIGTHFGGWSRNVNEWTKIADQVLYFEDLVKKPEDILNSIADFLELPPPDFNKMPTFKSQNEGEGFFGGKARKKLSDAERKNFSKKFFRKGESGVWKKEMNLYQIYLFWMKHGKTARKIGYRFNGDLNLKKHK